MSNGIDWYGETVGVKDEQQTPNKSGVNWFDETVSSNPVFPSMESKLSAEGQGPRLDVQMREPATTNEFGLAVKPESEKNFFEKVDTRLP